jgi:HEAT repeat protein
VALFAAGLLTWYHPKPRLRLSHRAVQIVRADVDLIDVGKFSAGCDASDTQAYLDRLVAGNPEAKDVACLAATASTATANAVIDAAPLTDPNVLRELRLRRNATSVLVGLGPAAVDPLCAHLGDPNDELRGVAAVSLGFAGTKEALACVNDALTAGTPVARTAAAVAFRRQVATGHVSLEQGWNTTTGLLHDTDAGGRIAGVGLLSLFAADVAGPAAQPLLDDADPAVAAAAKQAIGAIEAIGKTDFLEGAS